MTQHDIEIEILKNGKVRATIKGAKGKACLEYARLLELIVGKQTEQELTAEFYEPDETVRIAPVIETRGNR